MLTKERIKKSIDTLSEEPSIDEVIDTLILLEKIDQGLKDVAEGNVYTTDEVVKHLLK
ncbi:MAG: hypothetical protein K9H64_00570 [Bacteroidales bacterium]|nr:hypothetical protein [Bacteroidales bacterium]MCF8454385.1 hypothetical protein [Bacteroidales bacterium]